MKSLNRSESSAKIQTSASIHGIIDRKYVNSEHFKKLRSHLEDRNSNQNSAASIVSQLIFKEYMYVDRLTKLVDRMKDLTIDSSSNLKSLNQILCFHKSTLLAHLTHYSDPAEVYHIFSLFIEHFELYVKFIDNLQDFSYPAMDLSEVIIDVAKARLLEYNFTMFELQSYFHENPELHQGFSEIIVHLKNLFHKINVTYKRQVALLVLSLPIL